MISALIEFEDKFSQSTSFRFISSQLYDTIDINNRMKGVFRMETMKEFAFYPRYLSLAAIKGIKVADRIINDLIIEDETCLGNRQVGSRSYHIFYFKNQRFAVYYHGGGTDSMYSSSSLDEVVDYVNKLKPEDFE